MDATEDKYFNLHNLSKAVVKHALETEHFKLFACLIKDA